VDTVAFQYVLKEEMPSASPTGFKKLCEKRLSNQEHNLYLLNNAAFDADNNEVTDEKLFPSLKKTIFIVFI
jgi:hypothetical protein